MKTSGEIIDGLKNGKVFYKIHHDDEECIEYIFFECNRIGLRGWSSAIGNELDRLQDIIQNPKKWLEIEDFNMEQGYPYPWSTIKVSN
jgi:hypothetical protein